MPDERYWTVVDGRYGLADHAPNGIPQKTYSREPYWNGYLWQDYRVSAYLAFESSAEAWPPGLHDDSTSILFRVVDEENYMELRFEPWGWGVCQAFGPKFLYPDGAPAGVVALYSHRDGEAVFLGHCPFGQLDESCHRVHIDLRGGTCLVYIGSSLCIDTGDAYPLAGGIGLQTAAYHYPSQFLEKEEWHEVWFDDVYVRGFLDCTF